MTKTATWPPWSLPMHKAVLPSTPFRRFRQEFSNFFQDRQRPPGQLADRLMRISFRQVSGWKWGKRLCVARHSRSARLAGGPVPPGARIHENLQIFPVSANLQSREWGCQEDGPGTSSSGEIPQIGFQQAQGSRHLVTKPAVARGKVANLTLMIRKSIASR